MDDETTPPLLELTDIARRYAAGDRGGTDVLRGITLRVDRGESIAIVGPSGSGKSTLLNIIGGLDEPDGGSVRLEGRDLAGLSADDLAALRNRSIGFVFQSHHLLPQCTALENVLVPTLVSRDASRREPPAERARRLLEMVGLGARLSHRPGQLSGGECQRVAVVRALINDPMLLLADEPTGSLDGVSADELARQLIALNEAEGVTLILVTHSMRLADRMSRTLELRDGRIVPSGGVPRRSPGPSPGEVTA